MTQTACRVCEPFWAMVKSRMPVMVSNGADSSSHGRARLFCMRAVNKIAHDYVLSGIPVRPMRTASRPFTSLVDLPKDP